MKNIILYGAPASGKGTQCELLVKNYGYKHISTGDLFRNLGYETELEKQIHETIDQGKLVDDEVTAKLVKQELDKLENSYVVLDGFPRNVNQAKMLDTFVDNYMVINIEVDKDIALKRSLGRLTCSNCGKIYNKYFEESKPSKENICDICNIELTGRNDDNEESFNNRFNIYLNNVKDVLDYYENKKILRIIPSTTPNETFNSIKNLLEENNGNN